MGETNAPNERLKWRSVEHAIDYWVVCEKLRQLDEDPGSWGRRADRAKRFVFAMWEKDHFWTGTTAEHQINRGAVPSDVQVWSVLAMGHDPAFRQVIGWDGTSKKLPSCIQWVESNCRVGIGPFRGYRFSNQGEGCWPEGAAQLAAAYRYVGTADRADEICREIAKFNLVAARDARTSMQVAGPIAPGAIRAAYPVAAKTGFIKDFGGPVPEAWVYLPRDHVGATAWFVLATQPEGSNPYWLHGPPLAKTIEK